MRRAIVLSLLPLAMAASLLLGGGVVQGAYIVGWGRNECGRTDVPTGDDFTAIAAGTYHGVALRSDGSVAGWGWDAYGQTGVPAGIDFSAIAAGDGYSVALWSDSVVVPEVSSFAVWSVLSYVGVGYGWWRKRTN